MPKTSVFVRKASDSTSKAQINIFLRTSVGRTENSAQHSLFFSCRKLIPKKLKTHSHKVGRVIPHSSAKRRKVGEIKKGMFSIFGIHFRQGKNFPLFLLVFL
jgi:hypothetical protein